MFTRQALIIFAAFMLSTSMVHAQFVNFLPSDLGQGLGDGPVNESFDISSSFSKPDNTVTLNVSNGFVNAAANAWTVSETETTSFTISSIFDFQGFVQHGANLGSEAFADGSDSRVPRRSIRQLVLR